MAKYILALAILISASIRIFFISQSVHTADIYLMYTMGASYLKGDNPYLSLDFNSYPPLAIYLEAISMIISSKLHLSFVTVFKFWPNLADLLCTILIYRFLIKLKTKPIPAALWASFYILNPVSILISSAHGQLDAITSFFVLFSIYTALFPIRKYNFLSALSLGIAIAIKPNPAMLIPFFLIFRKISLGQKINYLLIVFAPLIISFMPFFQQNPLRIVSLLLGYSGVGDLSYSAILRSLWYQHNAQTNLPFNPEFLQSSKIIFLSGASFLLLLFINGKQLVKSLLAVYLLFLTFYFGIASQYLVWILPLAIIEKDKKVLTFSLLASFTLISFYLFFGPDILLGKLSNIPPFQTKYIYIYFLSNVCLWLFNLWWLKSIVFAYFKKTSLTFNTGRKRLLIVNLLIFAVSFIPMIYLLKKLFEVVP